MKGVMRGFSYPETVKNLESALKKVIGDCNKEEFDNGKVYEAVAAIEKRTMRKGHSAILP